MNYARMNLNDAVPSYEELER